MRTLETARRYWPEALLAVAILASQRTCQKRGYRSRSEAERELRDLATQSRKRENKKVSNRLHSYFCWPCGYWHIGHDNT